MAEGQDAVEEERRCLYVALTRAENRLVVTRSLDSINSNRFRWDSEAGKYVPERPGEANGEKDEDRVETYFFNGLPAGLFDSETPGEIPDAKDDSYSGPQAEWSPFSDFDFS